MDSLIAAAARALAGGDVLGALGHVALRDDPPALALRGIAMAQLGELARARELLRLAIRRFGSGELLARARCLVADAEVALALRELHGLPQTLTAAAETLDARGDRINALHARLVAIRSLLLLGRIEAAAASLACIDTTQGPPALAAIAALARTEIALRSLRTRDARDALALAKASATRAGAPALVAEVDEVGSALERPAARCLGADGDRLLRLHEIESLLERGTVVVDACRRGLRVDADWRPLARRPILFALLRALAEAWPEPAARAALIERAFRLRDPDDTHRARLRVELGRLRALLAPIARIEARGDGFVLRVPDARDVVVLVPPIDDAQAALLALLGDGAAWSSSALALALDTNQRSVQRALMDLEAKGQVRSAGRARAQRWVAPPLTGFTTILLLPAAMPAG